MDTKQSCKKEKKVATNMKNTVILKQNNLCDVSAAVTPFDVFVFSDALTLDKSGKTGTRSKELSLCHKL